MTDRFISFLIDISHREDRAALAALRRGLNPSGEAYVYPYVVPFLGDAPQARYERAYFLVAPLFALHPSESGVTLAHALREVKSKTDSESVERRFVALLNAHVDDLSTHLRHAVSLTRSHEINLDWQDLLSTVIWWDDGRRRRQRKWAKDFWGYQREGDEE